MYLWSRSYLFITVIFIVVFTVILLATSAMYRQQMENSDRRIIEHARSVMDDVFEGLKRSSSSIWLDGDIVSLFKIGDDISNDQYADINEAVKKLTKVQIANGNIASLSLVDALHNRVYTTGGVVDIPTYYSLSFSQEAGGYYDFMDILGSSASEAYFISPSYSGFGTISYIRGFGYSGRGNLNQSIIITAHTQTFIDRMKSIKNIGTDTDVYIIGEDGNLMGSTGGDIYKNIHVSDLKGNSGSIQVRHNAKKYTLWYEKSMQGKWIYIIAHPKSQYYVQTLTLYLIFSVGFGIIMIFAVMYTRRFMRNNYGPLLLILNMLGRNGDEEIFQNEFEIIAKGIEDMRTVNKDLDKRIYDQNRILRNTFLEKLFLGSEDCDPGVLSDNLYMYDIKFKGDKFLAFVVFVDEYTEVGSDNEIYTFAQIEFIISNVMEEIINGRHYGILFECNNVISGIVNINDDYADTIKKDMKEAVLRAQEFIFKNFSIKFTVAFSSVFDNIANANEGYIEAVDTMKYKNIMGIDDTLFYEDIGNTNNNGYYYPFDIEHRLRNLILTGNAKDAKQLIGTVIDENLNNKQVAPDLIQYLILNISSTVVRTMNEMSIEDSKSILQNSDIISRISHEESMHKKTESLYALIDNITSMTVKTAGVKNNWIITGVIPYIEENYADCNLSVSMIAEHFGMHPVYTSRLFKEQTGVGLLEYISKYRIEKAKEILKNTDNTLETVSEQVGYATSRTFARMFKKTEGITPGKYREMHRNHDNI